MPANLTPEYRAAEAAFRKARDPRKRARTSTSRGGLIMAEALMLELGKQIGRQRAHDAVYDAAQAAVTEGRPFRETLAKAPYVSARHAPSQIEALLDPARYAGLCRQFAERGAATGREIATRIRSTPMR